MGTYLIVFLVSLMLILLVLLSLVIILKYYCQLFMNSYLRSEERLIICLIMILFIIHPIYYLPNDFIKRIL